MAHATQSELAEYMGYDSESDLPDGWDWDRLLDRATEFIDWLSRDKIDTDETDQKTAARKATCAQIEWWYQNEDELGIKGNISSLNTGDYSVTLSDQGGGRQGLPIIAPRAKRFLSRVGLTYTGVDLK